MKLLFLGDVYGEPGRDVIARYLPDLKKSQSIDFVVINGENTTHGSGITPEHANAFFYLGVDCITTGNHAWGKREIIPFMEKDKRVLRPANFPKGTPGTGAQEYVMADGRKILVVNIMGRLFMDPLDCPFQVMDTILKPYNLGKNVHAIFVDIHTETTSEKTAMGNYLDGRISGIVGTHTHVPTADHRILPHGTAYQTDGGMCGNFDSIIGTNKEHAIQRFTKKLVLERKHPAQGEATMCGCIISIDDHTGLANGIKPIRMGGVLEQSLA